MRQARPPSVAWQPFVFEPPSRIEGVGSMIDQPIRYQMPTATRSREDNILCLSVQLNKRTE